MIIFAKREEIGMKIQNIAGYSSIDAFVGEKLTKYKESDRSFQTLFSFMFSEKENILYERSQGYSIQKTTYGEAYIRAKKRASTLRRLLKDCPPDSFVGLYMNNSLEWILNFWAILAAGHKPLLMNLRMDKELLEETIGSLDVVCVISDSISFAVRTIMDKDLVEDEQEAVADTFGSAVFVMSSGTSEHVKVCAYTAEEFYYQIHDSYQIIKNCKLMKKHYEGELKHLVFLPFYHIFGLVAMYIWFGFFSRTFVHLNDMAPDTIIKTIRRHKVTHIFAVPMFWEKVYEQAMKTIQDKGEATFAKFQKGLNIADRIGDVPGLGAFFKKKAFAEVRRNLFGESICFMITGGSDIAPEVMRFFNGIGYHLADGYGMSEIGITSVALGKNSKELNRGSVGMPFSSLEYKIDADGQLLVAGKSMAKYILQGGERRERPTWFPTRDLAVREAKGYRILGRADDLVIGGSGENLNPVMVEKKFKCKNVQEVCLIGPKEEGVTIPTILISIKKSLGNEAFMQLDEEIKKALHASGFASQLQKVVYVTNPLLGAEDFKLKRQKITREYQEGKLTIVEPGKLTVQEQPENEKLLQSLRLLMAAVLSKEAEEISLDADFFMDLGGNSLEYFAFCAEVKEAFRVEIPMQGESGLKNLKDFYDYVESKQSEWPEE